MIEDVPTVSIYDLALRLDTIRDATLRQLFVAIILAAMQTGLADEAAMAKAEAILKP